jgi:hypothetical protein
MFGGEKMKRIKSIFGILCITCITIFTVYKVNAEQVSATDFIEITEEEYEDGIVIAEAQQFCSIGKLNPYLVDTVDGTTIRRRIIYISGTANAAIIKPKE